MKRFFFLMIFTASTLCLTFAQQEEQLNSNEFKTIFGEQDIRISGMGGPFMEFSSIGKEFAHYMGGGGAFIFNDFFVGGYGMGKTNNITPPDTTGTLDFGFGGLWFGYSPFANKAIHPSFHLKTGWGGAHIRNTEDPFKEIASDNSIFVIAPTAEVELNFSRYFRLAMGISYHYVTGIDGTELKGYSNSDFSGLSGVLSFKFGWFK